MLIQIIFKIDSNEIVKNKSTINLLSIGRLIELKGHDLAIRAVNKLVTQGYNIKYFIVGNGEQYEELNSLIKGLGLEKCVNLLGNKSQEEVLSIIKKADIFLMPSTIDKSGRAEAQGQVTAEAQALGVPVIAFNSGGVKETIIDNETGILVEDKNILAFSQAIELLIDDKSLREKMGKKGIEFVKQKFNLKTNTELLFSYY